MYFLFNGFAQKKDPASISWFGFNIQIIEKRIREEN
jgi:hypothetical protein